ncbi:hypothetical protein [Anaerosporobacter faecicola]|uniref:hypothetical protein n=1 Tax=Anaerosporobacter faecicola TaxID=2718714 RepID=UPI00143AFAE0|nr:hypothetical protein [Anaerosporobacter faecicola]
MIYENRFYVTKEMYREYARKVLSRSVYRIGGILDSICILLIIIGLVSGDTTLLCYYAIAFLLITGILIITPRMMLKQLWDYDRRIHMGQRPECTVLFGERISMTEGKCSVEIEYDQVIAIYKMKTCNIVMFTKNNGILYTDEGFDEKRTQFDEYILQACKNVEKIKYL